MFNNLLKNLLTGVSNVFKPKPQQSVASPTPNFTQAQTGARPQQSTNAVNSLPLAGMSSANSAQSAQLRTPSFIQPTKTSSYAAPTNMSVQPTSSTGSTGGSSNFVSTLANSLMSAVTPKVYAADGSPELAASTDSYLKQQIANNPLFSLYSNTRQSLANSGYIRPETGNFGQLIQNILSPHMGSAGTVDLGVSEFLPNFLSKSPLSKEVKWLSQKGLSGLNKPEGSTLGVSTDNIDARNQLDQSNKTSREMESVLEKQRQNYFSSGGGGSSSYGGSGSGLTSGINNSARQIDAETNAILDQLMAERNAGNISEDEFARRTSEAQLAAKNKLYDQQIASLDSEVPLLNKEYETTKADIEGQLTGQQAQAEKLKTQNKNLYGELMRKQVKNAEISTGNLRNMFSSLGTADSSAFINKAGQIEQDKLNDVGASDREMTGKIADIDNAILTLQNNIKSDVNKLTLQRDKALSDIANNRRMSEAQKAASIDEVNANLYNTLMQLEQQRNQQKDAFLAMKAQLVANTGELLKKGTFDGSAYNNLSGIQTFNSGTDNQTSNSRPITTQKSKKYNPFSAGEYRLNPETGTYEWVNYA